MNKELTKILVAIITALGVIVAALIGAIVTKSAPPIVIVQQSGKSDVIDGNSTLPNLTHAINTTKDFEVFANQEWQDTGINVDVGQLIEITYLRGQWSQCVNYTGPGCEFVDAAGLSRLNANVALPECHEAMLVARIGANSGFCAGRRFSMTASESGHLNLRINDTVTLEDNGGSLWVKIDLRDSR